MITAAKMRVVALCGEQVMRSLLKKTSLLACVLGLLALTAPADGQNAKVPSIKEVMAKLNKGPNALGPTLGKAIKAETPNWDEIQKETQAFQTYVAALLKHDPPRGDRASWDKLTKAYLQGAQALDAAAQKKDKAAATAAHAKLANSANCNACHNAHRG